MKKISFCIFFVFCVFHPCENAKILGIFPTPSISHQIVYRQLFLELASRGHELTILTPDPINTTLGNYKQVDVRDVSYSVWNKAFNFASHGINDIKAIQFLDGYFTVMWHLTDLQLQQKSVKDLMNTSEKFDLIFYEAFIPTYFPLKDKQDCPMILVTSLSTIVINMDSLGNPTNPVLYPDVVGEHMHPMSFFEKMEPVYNALYLRYRFWTHFGPEINKIAKKHFGENTRDVYEIESEADMMFLNIEPIFLGTRPTVPAIIYMGGVHLKEAKPLPKDLQSIMDQSEAGVIYFSLGSNVKSKDLSFSIIEMFLQTFKELPYTVLWKFENKTLEGKPENVHISEWYPQQDLLVHKNIKLFITQCGLQSLEEAINSTVPVIGLPFFADQKINAKAVLKHHIGRTWNLKHLDKKTIKEDIIAVIETESYKENILKLSRIIKDKPQKSLERAVWWTEYVLRHKGAKHLRSPSADVPFYESLLLDIIAFWIAIVLLIIFAIRLIIRFIMNWFVSKKTKKE